ncbi:helix-turn-helix domain-containing protein [Flavobacterium flevense]|uniref:helix-turn-helix domain-containing protein n=1 Tax=Flavobacterium flevense TaxID=983 RepID=UPI001F35F304|nr:helix-turn-helix transcriptional regulator [Flavobacterium flevense]
MAIILAKMKNYSIHKTPLQVQTELAERLRKIRKEKKISQSELASKSGVSLGSIKRFEHTGEIALASLLKLAHLFDKLDDFDAVFKPDDNLKEIEKLFK